MFTVCLAAAEESIGNVSYPSAIPLYNCLIHFCIEVIKVTTCFSQLSSNHAVAAAHTQFCQDCLWTDSAAAEWTLAFNFSAKEDGTALLLNKHIQTLECLANVATFFRMQRYDIFPLAIILARMQNMSSSIQIAVTHCSNAFWNTSRDGYTCRDKRSQRWGWCFTWELAD